MFNLLRKINTVIRGKGKSKNSFNKRYLYPDRGFTVIGGAASPEYKSFEARSGKGEIYYYVVFTNKRSGVTDSIILHPQKEHNFFSPRSLAKKLSIKPYNLLILSWQPMTHCEFLEFTSDVD